MKTKLPKVSVVIPSRATNYELLFSLFSCLENQSFQDFEVVVVCDRNFSEGEWNDFLKKFSKYSLDLKFLSHRNSKFLPQSQ